MIDELGYLPMPGEAASHLFQAISRHYEHGKVVWLVSSRTYGVAVQAARVAG